MINYSQEQAYAESLDYISLIKFRRWLNWERINKRRFIKKSRFNTQEMRNHILYRVHSSLYDDFHHEREKLALYKSVELGDTEHARENGISSEMEDLQEELEDSIDILVYHKQESSRLCFFYYSVFYYVYKITSVTLLIFDHLTLLKREVTELLCLYSVLLDSYLRIATMDFFYFFHRSFYQSVLTNDYTFSQFSSLFFFRSLFFSLFAWSSAQYTNAKRLLFLPYASFTFNSLIAKKSESKIQPVIRSFRHNCTLLSFLFRFYYVNFLQTFVFRTRSFFTDTFFITVIRLLASQRNATFLDEMFSFRKVRNAFFQFLTGRYSSRMFFFFLRAYTQVPFFFFCCRLFFDITYKDRSPRANCPKPKACSQPRAGPNTTRRCRRCRARPTRVRTTSRGILKLKWKPAIQL